MSIIRKVGSLLFLINYIYTQIENVNALTLYFLEN